MNWQEKFVQIIMKQYPKSIALMRGNFKSSQIWKLQYMSNPRLLYDFFDSQGIYIGIVYQYCYNSLDACDHYYFDWEIMFGVDDKIISSDVEEPTRTEAEEKAFEKAFEILERKLK